MKNFGIRCTLLAAVAAVAVGSGSAQMGDTSAQDKMFLKMSAQGGMAEIQAAQMALKKSKNDEVKAYAQKMIDDHTMLMANMKPFMDKMSVPPPAKLKKTDEEEARRLKAKSGAAFDKEYVSAMVADHHKDLGDFKHEATTTSNPDLKATVEQGTQVIQQHTDMIDAIAQKMSIPTPPAGQ